MQFSTNCRATHPGVVLKVAVFRKHLSFSICHPQRGIDKGKMLSKKISLILQDNNSGIQPICGKVGLVGQVWMGGHGPILCHGSTQV